MFKKLIMILFTVLLLTGCANPNHFMSFNYDNNIKNLSKIDMEGGIVFLYPAEILKTSDTIVILEVIEKEDKVGFVGMLNVDTAVIHKVREGRHDYLLYGNGLSKISVNVKNGEYYYLFLKNNTVIEDINVKYDNTVSSIKEKLKSISFVQPNINAVKYINDNVDYFYNIWKNGNIYKNIIIPSEYSKKQWYGDDYYSF